MPSLAFRKASICSRFSFSASCTLVVNPQHAICSRLILYWKLSSPSGSSCIGKDYVFTNREFSGTILFAVRQFWGRAAFRALGVQYAGRLRFFRRHLEVPAAFCQCPALPRQITLELPKRWLRPKASASI